MSLWTTTWVRHFIYTRFGLEYCRERIRQVRHTLGFRLRRLRDRHWRAKAEAQVALVTELEELVAAWPEEWELICVDEATRRCLKCLQATIIPRCMSMARWPR